MPFDAQLKEHFPDDGARLLGYCGAEFKETPPSHAPMATNSRENIDDSNEKIEFYECRGKPIVVDCCFVTKSAWVIPFDTGNIKEDEIYDCIQALPMTITVFGNTYELAGYSLHQGTTLLLCYFGMGRNIIMMG